MRTYIVYFKDDEGAIQSYKVLTTDRLKAKLETMIACEIDLSQIFEVL